MSDVAASIISTFALIKNSKKHKMLGFGGDCFLGRKLNGRMIEGADIISQNLFVFLSKWFGVNLLQKSPFDTQQQDYQRIHLPVAEKTITHI